MCVGVEAGVGGPGIGVHPLQTGGDPLAGLAGQTLLAGLEQLAVGELESESGHRTMNRRKDRRLITWSETPP